MATYLFYCAACDQHEERRIPIVDSGGPQLCDGCGNTLKRVYTVPGVSFKGGGWGGQG